MKFPVSSPFPTPILILDRVSKRFAGHIAVDELSLSVPRGVIYGLLGPNGAGKTTTIRMIMDILEPDGGVVQVFGETDGGRAHSERIGYLPEERGLYRKMRVLDVLVFLGEMKGIDRRRARQRAGEWLERLGLAQWRLRRVDELSKGMQQKVQFISTVLHDPDLLVLDEPFSGLDPVNTQVMKDTVLDLRRRGKTILFSTHIMEQAEKLCEQLHHRAGPEAGGRRALGHQADTWRTPSRHRIRRQRRRRAATLCRPASGEEGGRLRAVRRARARGGGRRAGDPAATRSLRCPALAVRSDGAVAEQDLHRPC